MRTENMMHISHYYKLLDIPVNASDEAVAASFKKLALKYHPDKNRDRVEWANEAMKKLNMAYSTIMSHRFESTEIPVPEKEKKPEPKKTPPREKKSKPEARQDADHEIEKEFLIKSFIQIRESAKESLYKFFQYSLYNIKRREQVSNRGTYNTIVFSLRKSYHSIRKLAKKTKDPELMEHFDVFSKMLFNFYRAAECLNVIDSYNNQYDVDAYRSYKAGDEALHLAHRELFYDRHNRGFFKSGIVTSNILESEQIFKNTVKYYPGSSWVVETNIKLEYVIALKVYIELFFSEE